MESRSSTRHWSSWLLRTKIILNKVDLLLKKNQKPIHDTNHTHKHGHHHHHHNDDHELHIKQEEMEALTQEVQSKIREINQRAEIIPTAFSRVPMEKLLEQKLFSLERELERDKEFLSFRPFRQHDFRVYSLCFEAAGELELEKFTPWIESLLGRYSEHIFRVKGVIYVKSKEGEKGEGKYVLQGVHSTFNIQRSPEPIPTSTPEPSPSSTPLQKVNKLIFIGQGLPYEEIAQSFNETQGGPAINLKKKEGSSAPSPFSTMIFGLCFMALINPEKSWNFFCSHFILMGFLCSLVIGFIYIRNVQK
eukprot:TRINITY_DN464_c0_g2_i2.p1 TRINITY_DN464_c0_g2~~TRINITY_DN464_c0_g2_i2.p1  ORF type:complete len:305 (-),score=75.10 TRINITY_DN464_c0_g2_i2:186-1100(-)